jgi:hypothetical protein
MLFSLVYSIVLYSDHYIPKNIICVLNYHKSGYLYFLSGLLIILAPPTRHLLQSLFLIQILDLKCELDLEKMYFFPLQCIHLYRYRFSTRYWYAYRTGLTVRVRVVCGMCKMWTRPVPVPSTSTGTCTVQVLPVVLYRYFIEH